jgi:hypothetical protein
LASADLDGRLAEQARNDFVAVMLLYKHVLATVRIGTLNGKDHISRADG